MDFCSGEKFSKLCDVSIYNANYLSKFKNIKEHCNNIILENSLVNEEQLINFKTFFVKPECLPFFIKEVLPKIKNKFVLVTHNSDAIVGQNKEILENKYLVKWFGQNIYSHTKTQGIPIGIENSQWKGSDFRIIQKYQNIPKKHLLYLNFSLGTNKIRENVLNIFLNKGFIKNDKLPWKKYINFLAEHKFCIAPIGNGPDTHRLWECLYLGVIPISEKHPCLYPHFKDLPILWVDTYEEVNKEMLEKIEIKGILEKTKLSYWKEEIYKNL